MQETASYSGKKKSMETMDIAGEIFRLCVLVLTSPLAALGQGEDPFAERISLEALVVHARGHSHAAELVGANITPGRHRPDRGHRRTPQRLAT